MRHYPDEEEKEHCSKPKGTSWMKTLRQGKLDVFESLTEGQGDQNMTSKQENIEGPSGGREANGKTLK